MEVIKNKKKFIITNFGDAILWELRNNTQFNLWDYNNYNKSKSNKK